MKIQSMKPQERVWPLAASPSSAPSSAAVADSGRAANNAKNSGISRPDVDSSGSSKGRQASSKRRPTSPSEPASSRAGSESCGSMVNEMIEKYWSLERSLRLTNDQLTEVCGPKWHLRGTLNRTRVSMLTVQAAPCVHAQVTRTLSDLKEHNDGKETARQQSQQERHKLQQQERSRLVKAALNSLSSLRAYLVATLTGLSKRQRPLSRWPHIYAAHQHTCPLTRSPCGACGRGGGGANTQDDDTVTD